MKVTHHALVEEPIITLDAYIEAGGLRGLTAAIDAGADATIELIESAGIRGRGGAGFPTGRKWRSLKTAIGPDDAGFVVVNAAEGEPGTFKDRSLLRVNPFLVLEGAIIAARTLAVDRIVVATKARYVKEIAIIRSAANALDAAGHTSGLRIDIVEGPDHYLFGEETAMLSVIEGDDPLPRHLPPYEYGLFTTSPQLGWSAGIDDSPTGPASESANPALVNNVETFGHVALVCRNGADWYRSMGTAESPGPTIITFTGDVSHAGVCEVALGTNLAEAIETIAGGVLNGGSAKAVLSGVSNPILKADELDVPITYEHLAAAGGGLGSGGFIVYDTSRNMIDVAYQVLRFLHVESCGQCNACKTGTGDIARGLERLVVGTNTIDDILALFTRRSATVTDASRCYLPRQAQVMLASLLQRFPEDLGARAEVAGDLLLPLPKLIDLVDGVAHNDPTLVRKLPDWTYAETPVVLNT